uniref:Uncharacterized protein LOC104219609 isoform X2 n=1 Tax=Nicotiana sylvestris TaxID=4096 RepID=A0A1U7VKT8_NICSY|nr:PREDICTED: uncharacterized protein LOC104219609 isoform X2 [Nicotiana sylvestris]
MTMCKYYIFLSVFFNFMCELYMMQANKKGLHSEYEQTKLNRADNILLPAQLLPTLLMHYSEVTNVLSKLSRPVMRDSLLLPEIAVLFHSWFRLQELFTRITSWRSFYHTNYRRSTQLIVSGCQFEVTAIDNNGSATTVISDESAAKVLLQRKRFMISVMSRSKFCPL